GTGLCGWDQQPAGFWPHPGLACDATVNGWAFFRRYRFLYIPGPPHDSSIARTPEISPRLHSLPPQPRFGDSRAAPTTRRLQAAASAALPQTLRPALLGGAVLPLGSMDRRAHHRQAGNRCPLASGRLPALLALPLARLGAGPAKDRHQRLRTGQAHGRGKSFLGRAENPWRA